MDILTECPVTPPEGMVFHLAYHIGPGETATIDGKARSIPEGLDCGMLYVTAEHKGQRQTCMMGIDIPNMDDGLWRAVFDLIKKTIDENPVR